MKYFDVVAISPITQRETVFREVPASSLRQNDSGETLFCYTWHGSVEVIAANVVPESRLQALEREYDL